MFAGIGRRRHPQFSDPEPTRPATQRLHVRQSAALVRGKVEPQARRLPKTARLGTGDRLDCERPFRKAEEFPSLFVGEWPFGRIGVAALIEATFIVRMETDFG